MKLKIGNVELENNLILAPMAGVTDQSFRRLCREQGCGLLYTEMVSAKAILYNNRNTKELLEVSPEERPIAVQLFGSDPEIVGSIAHQIEDGPYDIIDINMGCPVPKIVNNGEGSALMKNPKLVEQLLTSMVKQVKNAGTEQELSCVYGKERKAGNEHHHEGETRPRGERCDDADYGRYRTDQAAEV